MRMRVAVDRKSLGSLVHQGRYLCTGSSKLLTLTGSICGCNPERARVLLISLGRLRRDKWQASIQGCGFNRFNVHPGVLT